MRILGEIRALQAQRHEIVLTTYHNGRDVENLEIRRIINVPWYKKLEAGASWHKIYLDTILLLKTIETYRRERPEIIHGHLHEGALIGKLVSLLVSGGKTPVVFDVQGSLTGELESYGFFKKLKLLKFLWKYIEKLICRLPDYFVCSSDSNLRFIVSQMNVPKNKVVAIWDGIDNNFFLPRGNRTLRKKLGISADKKIALYTGSLIQSKGINYLFEAIRNINKNSSKINFVIVGYPLEPVLSNAKEMGIHDNVSFVGKLDFTKLPEYLALADVAVDPKVDHANEGSGKILNYMGAGLPVVCFDTLNNRMILGPNGIYAEPANAEDLANKIIEALGNVLLATDIGMRNQKRAYENFSWTSSGKKLSEVYLKVTSQT
jgi:glycosyltransferase involved in cell wall biosynthesis